MPLGKLNLLQHCQIGVEQHVGSSGSGNATQIFRQPPHFCRPDSAEERRVVRPDGRADDRGGTGLYDRVSLTGKNG